MSRDPLPNPNLFKDFDDDFKVYEVREPVSMGYRIGTFLVWPLIAVAVTFVVAILMVAAWPFVVTDKFQLTRRNKYSAK